MIDSMVVNSWKIDNIVNESKKPQLQSRSDLAISLLIFSGDAENTEDAPNARGSNLIFGRPSKIALPNGIRFDSTRHIIRRTVDSARKKCRLCENNSFYLCKKCKLHLHPDCFKNLYKKY